jgi:hypothetical protein
LAAVLLGTLAERIGLEDSTSLRNAWAAAMPGDPTVRLTTEVLQPGAAQYVQDTLVPLLARLPEAHADIGTLGEDSTPRLLEALERAGVRVFRAREGLGPAPPSKFFVLRSMLGAVASVYGN